MSTEAERFIVDRSGDNVIVFDRGDLKRIVCFMPEGKVEDARGSAMRIATMLNKDRAEDRELLREALRKLSEITHNFLSLSVDRRWATRTEVEAALKTADRILAETKP